MEKKLTRGHRQNRATTREVGGKKREKKTHTHQTKQINNSTTSTGTYEAEHRTRCQNKQSRDKTCDGKKDGKMMDGWKCEIDSSPSGLWQPLESMINFVEVEGKL